MFSIWDERGDTRDCPSPRVSATRSSPETDEGSQGELPSDRQEDKARDLRGEGSIGVAVPVAAPVHLSYR